MPHDVTPKDPNWYKKFDGLRLSEQTKANLRPTESFSKSDSIQRLMKVQDQVIDKAKKSGDASKVREADQFAARLQKEVNFIRYSK